MIKCNKWWRFLFWERTIKREQVVESGKTFVTSSRIYKCSPDTIVASLTRLALLIGLLISVCNLSAAVKKLADNESGVVENDNSLLEAKAQIEAVCDTLSDGTMNLKSAAQHCAECAKQLSACTDELRSKRQNVLLLPYCPTWRPWCVWSWE